MLGAQIYSAQCSSGYSLLVNTARSAAHQHSQVHHLAELQFTVTTPTMTGTSMKAIAVIPARLASTRLSRKMLREIAGQPLVGRVYEAVKSSPLLDDVIIATDSDEIIGVCRHNRWKAQLTASSHRSGTERVHEVSQSV